MNAMQFRRQPSRSFKPGFVPYAGARRTSAIAASRVLRQALVATRRPARPTGWRVARRAGRSVLRQSDFKYVDLANASYEASTTGSITLVATIPQGNTVNNREGKSCQLTSCRVRGVVSVASTTTTVQAAAYLVWDRQPNKALAAITDVLDSVSSYSFPKRENSERFMIIKQWRCVLEGNSAAPATGDEQIDIDDYVKLPPECVSSYTVADTTGVIGDLITGALLFVTCGNRATGTTAASFTVGFRVNFRD